MKTLQRKNGSLVVTVQLTLRPGRDDNLITLVRQTPRGALAGVIRKAAQKSLHFRQLRLPFPE